MAKRIDSTPKKDGFRMPGEFEKQSGVYMLWPQRTDNWRNGAKPAQEEFVAVAHSSDILAENPDECNYGKFY